MPPVGKRASCPLHDQELRVGGRSANAFDLLIFWRSIERACRVHRRELEHNYTSRRCLAFENLSVTAAHQESPAVFRDDRRSPRGIAFVGFPVVNSNLGDEVSSHILKYRQGIGSRRRERIALIRDSAP